MTVEHFIPSEVLQPYINGYVIVESEHGTINTLYPDTAIVMAFRFRGVIAGYESGTLPQSVITGIRKSPRTIVYGQKTSNLIVKFREGAASVLFKESLHGLHSLTLSLDHLVPSSVLQRIEEQLAEAGGHLQRIAIIENFLISLIGESRPDIIVQKAIHAMQLAGGDIRVDQLMAKIPLSRDAFEKRFRKATGTTAKQFASIVRFNNLINSLSMQSKLTDAGLTAGYFDQSHFIKDFKAFTGMPPGEFIKLPKRW